MDINSAFPSTYLKAADLAGQMRTVTIERVALELVGDTDNKPVVYFVGIPKALVLNRTNGSAIANAYGTETNGWTGKQITLFSAPVSFQGRVVDAIRVTASSAASPGTAPQGGVFGVTPAQPVAAPQPAPQPQPEQQSLPAVESAKEPAAAGQITDDEIPW